MCTSKYSSTWLDLLHGIRAFNNKGFEFVIPGVGEYCVAAFEMCDELFGEVYLLTKGNEVEGWVPAWRNKNKSLIALLNANITVSLTYFLGSLPVLT